MRPGPDGGCGYAVEDETVPVRLRGAIGGRFVVRISYFTDSAADVRVRVGDHEARFRAVEGPNDVWLVVPDQEAVSTFRFDREEAGPGAVCIAGLVAGVPEAT
jgi:hypothetical protein